MASVASFVQANTSGRLHGAHEPSVSPLDRGFLYGDAIYEVWRTYGGVVFAWPEHLARLEASARSLRLSLPWSHEFLWGEVARTAAAFRQQSGFEGELYVRLQISRGAGPIGLDPALADEPAYVILIQPCPTLAADKLAAGLRVAVAGGIRRNAREALDPAWKTGNYLNNVLGLAEARAAGADEVALLNLRGELTEASTSNLGFIREGTLYTPVLEAGILAGITRALAIGRIAPAAGLRVNETTLRPEDIAGMEEAFLMSTTRDIVPVAAMDGVRFRVGPTTLTARLKAAFVDYALAEAARYPQRRV
jgi:branched-chain amino acid aminotransferase